MASLLAALLRPQARLRPCFMSSGYPVYNCLRYYLLLQQAVNTRLRDSAGGDKATTPALDVAGSVCERARIVLNPAGLRLRARVLHPQRPIYAASSAPASTPASPRARYARMGADEHRRNTHSAGARVGVHTIHVHKDACGRFRAGIYSGAALDGGIAPMSCAGARANVPAALAWTRIHTRVPPRRRGCTAQTYRASARARTWTTLLRVRCARQRRPRVHPELRACARRSALVARRAGSIDRIRHERAVSRLGWAARPDVVRHARAE
ncbi:hypothetical protein C8F04DRAFT_1237190 [Mycena alexandri]|uniref:Uncharacterized protein n=1 Tax=Mycena alexandri TaxID=1745969 RepID=A0AAD6SKQ5_9AGAR|nr:hypothetical protein C8F04DRAFT_1237190 [Mycena alexandri]